MLLILFSQYSMTLYEIILKLTNLHIFVFLHDLQKSSCYYMIYMKMFFIENKFIKLI